MAGTTQELADQLLALEEGRAFADRSAYRKTAVTGGDAERWLNDLLTAGLAGLPAGSARRSLLLTPTGRIRADITVARTREGFLLLQDPRQPDPIADLLARYVLSSDVVLTDRTVDLALYSVPGGTLDRDGLTGPAPSVLGEGEDLLVGAGEAERALTLMAARRRTEVGDPALEVWRIRRGVPRFPVDLDGNSLPAEAGLEDVIDAGKGCFLGQESVAKIRNLGHPPRVVRSAHADADVTVGAEVHAGGVLVGEVTSAAPAAGRGTAAIVRIGWAAAGSPLETADGAPLRGADAGT